MGISAASEVEVGENGLYSLAIEAREAHKEGLLGPCGTKPVAPCALFCGRSGTCPALLSLQIVDFLCEVVGQAVLIA